VTEHSAPSGALSSSGGGLTEAIGTGAETSGSGVELAAGATAEGAAGGVVDTAVLLVVIGSGRALPVVEAALAGGGGGWIVNMGAAPMVAVRLGTGSLVLELGTALIVDEGTGPPPADALGLGRVVPSVEIVMSAHW
jgi:hypothetical protein